MHAHLHHFATELQKIKNDGRYRSLTLPRGIDFASNDYLGFSTLPLLRQRFLDLCATEEVLTGAPASRLLRGQTEVHAGIEQRLADHKGVEAALLLSCGYMANLALISGVVSENDRVISDAQNHASIIDALRLVRCTKIIVPHLDMNTLEQALATPYKQGKTFVITESLFSMDGDIAALNQVADLCDAYKAALIVDDSHGIGVYGDQRRSGLSEYFHIEKRALAIVSTFGKALGVAGAAIYGSHLLKEYLVNCSRPFIFTTAVAPTMALGIHAALDILQQAPERATQVLQRSTQLQAALVAQGIDVMPTQSPIVPVLLYDNQRSVDVARFVQNSGYDVRAIRPPTVAPKTARLRVCVHADHTPEQIDGLAAAIVAGCNACK